MLSMAARVNQFSMQEGYGHSTKIPSPQNRFLSSVFGTFCYYSKFQWPKSLQLMNFGFKYKINMSFQNQT
jgi:hypothetical protein